MIKKRKDLICVFCFNVENYIDFVFKKIKKYKLFNKSFLFINDASTDDTFSKLKNFKKKNKLSDIKIINNVKNRGYGGNYKIAIKYSIKKNFDKLVFLHGDNQYPTNKINKLFKQLDINDLVFGSRISNYKSCKKNMPTIKIYVNKILSSFINLVFNVNYSEYFSGFRGFKVNKLKNIDLRKLSGSYPIEQEVHYIFIKRKFKISEFPIPTVYEGQVSRIPPIRYVLTTIYLSVLYSFFYFDLK